MPENLDEDQQSTNTTADKPVRPTTSTKPDHAKATARIFIDGLSLLCITYGSKPGTGAIEIGYLSDEHEPVEIVVFTSNGREFWSYKTSVDRQVRIEIKKAGSDRIGEFYEVGAPPPADPEDSRWMPDLEQWHTGGISIKGTAKSHLSAKAVINDATYYTALLSSGEAYRTDINTGETTTLTKVGRVLGGDIKAEAGELIEINIIGRDEATDGDIVLDSVQLDPALGQFTISLNYSRSACMHGDPLHLLYDYLIIPADNVQFTFSYKDIQIEWAPFAFVGNTDSKEYFPNRTQEADDIKDSLRALFDSAEAAESAGFSPGSLSMTIMTTEYACQSYGGGGGPLPDLP